MGQRERIHKGPTFYVYPGLSKACVTRGVLVLWKPNISVISKFNQNKSATVIVTPYVHNASDNNGPLVGKNVQLLGMCKIAYFLKADIDQLFDGNSVFPPFSEQPDWQVSEFCACPKYLTGNGTCICLCRVRLSVRHTVTDTSVSCMAGSILFHQPICLHCTPFCLDWKRGLKKVNVEEGSVMNCTDALVHH